MYPFLNFGHLHIPTYLTFISFIYILALLWVVKRAQAQQYSNLDAIDLSIAIMLGGFLGGRLLHILYEDPKYYFNNPLNIIKIWEGGFVFYGGLLGSILAAALICRKKHMNLGLWADLFAPIAAFGYALGRVACFLNGCCYGKICDLPWAVQFPSHKYLDVVLAPRHPTQLYAAGLETALGLLLLYFEKAKPSFLQRHGALFFFWLGFHGLFRIFMEVFRDDIRGEMILGLSISTWISLILILVSSIWFKRSSKALSKN